jgi:hypothetical protein
MTGRAWAAAVLGIALGALTAQPVAADGAPAALAGEGQVLVLRGEPSSPPPAPAPAAERELVPIAAGRTLWLVDERRDRLIGCRVERTSSVGVRRIRCGSAPFH